MIRTADEVALSLFEDCENAAEINRENLLKILSDNRDTVFGKESGFSSIRTPEEYGERVPLSDYGAYGEKLLCPGYYTCYPVYVTLATSGTTGKQKFFPLTEEALYRYSSFSLDLARHQTGAKGKIVHTNVFRSPSEGVAILSNTHLNWLRDSHTYDFSSFLGGEECNFSDEIGDVFYVKAYLALSAPDLCGFVSIFLYDLALFFSNLEARWPALLSDFRTGVISVPLPEKVRKTLLSLRPDEKRIRELERIFSEGFSTPIAPRLWKEMKYFVGIGGRSYRFQERALAKYVGDLPIHYAIYASSECMMGVSPEMSRVMGDARYVLLPRCAYYEFLTKKDSLPVRLEDLAVGGEYEPVVTTFSGLYRYRTGDILRVCSFRGSAPVFEVVGRRQLVIDVAGEKIDVPTASEAVERWAGSVGAEVTDFAIGIDASHVPHGYLLFAEVGDGEVPLLPGAFDRALCLLSPDYAELRETGSISRPSVIAVPKGTIFASIAATAKAAHKKPRVFISEAAAEYLLEKGIRRE